MVNWHQYLESLCNTYAQWWRVYTITDVVGRQKVESEPSPLLFDFGLIVQTVKRDREEKGKGEEKIERLSVLEGLHKYASNHVLLVGRPGSGKSTALARLLLDEAGKANLTPQPPSLRGKGEQISPLLPGEGQGERSIGHSNQPKIPVLVELRYYRTSILDLIQDFLQRHDPNLKLDAETLKSWLRQGELLLLVDGVNELPSDEARRDLHKFRQDYQKTTPMIFTTRDLGVGGDLDIAKKLEMQPLSEPQMQQFVRAYLPEQGDEMLRQLGSRLRELGQTPLLLWMLCSLFKTRGKVPPNLALVFRQFAQSYYDKLKQDVPISDESRRWCQLILQHLAWKMTQGREATELQVAISRQEAEEILTAYLRNEGFAQPRNLAMEWLADLLKHHLLQLGINDQIEFRHQLIQEHCTAEILLKLLPSLGDDQLKREYLNYLKWTEPLALMLELVEDEAQAVRVVKLALEVDLRLGARLAGEVKPNWQEQTVVLVVGLDVPKLLKIQLLGLTKSKKAIRELVNALNDENENVRRMADVSLHKIGSDAAIPGLVNALNDENENVRRMAAVALGEIRSDAAIPGLVNALNDENENVRRMAAVALGEIRSDAAIPGLVNALNDENENVRRMAAVALGEIGSNAAIPGLVNALNDENENVRRMAAVSLHKIAEKIALDAATIKLAKTIKDLLKDIPIERSDLIPRIRLASGCYPHPQEDSSRFNRKDFWGELIDAFNDANFVVRWRAAEALVKIRSDAAISKLVNALKDEDTFVRWAAAEALDKMGACRAIPELINAIFHPDPFVRWTVMLAGDEIKPNVPIIVLLKSLKHQDDRVRSKAAVALGKIGADIPELALNHENSEVRRSAIEALCIGIPSPALLPVFSECLKTSEGTDLLETISAIQERCKFYNYTLTQPNISPVPQKSEPKSITQPQPQPMQEDSSKSAPKRDQVFISYSHKDTKWLDELQTMLKPMMRNKTISVWADTDIKPGSKWRDEIEKALASANVAVLMVSQNFLASDFIAEHELPPLLNAAKQEGLKIIWVPVSYCLYEETDIGEYQAAHTPSQPLKSLKEDELDQVLVKICQEIKAASAAT